MLVQLLQELLVELYAERSVEVSSLSFEGLGLVLIILDILLHVFKLGFDIAAKIEQKEDRKKTTSAVDRLLVEF